MVQLRVDAELASVRSQFDRAAASVDNLSDEFDQAENAAELLGRAYTQSALRLQRLQSEARQTEDRLEDLRRQAAATNGPVPSGLRDSIRDLERQSRDAQREIGRTAQRTQQLGRAADEADIRLHGLSRALDDAHDEARALNRQLGRLDADASRGLRSVQRTLMGFRAGANRALSGDLRSTISDALRSAWQAAPVEVKGAVVLAGITVGTFFAAAVGGAIQAGLLTAIGGGVLAGGIALALKDNDAIQSAFSDVLRPIGEDVTRWASATFEGPLIKAAAVFGAAWTKHGDEVRGVFDKLAVAIEPLADGLSGMVDEAMPGFLDAIDAAVPLLTELGRQLPGLGQGLGDFLTAVSEGDGAVKALRFVMMTLSGTLTIVGGVIGWLSDAFDKLSSAAERITGAASKIPLLGRAFEGFHGIWQTINSDAEGSVRALDATGVASSHAADGLTRTKAAAQQAASAAVSLSEKLGNLIGTQLSMDQAALASKQALMELRDTLRENGRTLDTNTAKGQANTASVLSAVGAYEQQRQSAIALAQAQGKDVPAAVDAANATFRRQLAALEAVLRAAGFTQAQIDSLLGSYRAMANAPDITKTITIKGRVVGDTAAGNYVGLGGVFSRYASGTESAPAGWAWVGEEGPELMRFRGGEQVLSATESAALMSGASGGSARPTSGGGAGGGTNIILASGGGAGLQQQVADLFLALVRTGAIRLKASNNGRVVAA